MTSGCHNTWLVITLDALVYRELEWLKNLSHEPLLIYKGLMGLLLLSTRSRKCFSLESEAWNVIFQVLIISLHSDFLLKSYNHLHGRSRTGLNDLVSLSTASCRHQLLWLRHFQNSIVFSWFWEKKIRNSLRTKFKWD